MGFFSTRLLGTRQTTFRTLRGILDFTGLTALRTYTFPDISGTVAMDFSGKIVMYAGVGVPDATWLRCDGATVSRTAYAALFGAITIPRSAVNTTSGSNVLTGASGWTSGLGVGFPVTGPGIPVGATVAGILNSSQLTISVPATATGSVSVLFMPYGIGDGTAATFSVPDFGGRMPVGTGNGAPTVRISGVAGGEEVHLLTTAEMPIHSHGGTSGRNFVTLGPGSSNFTFGAGANSVNADAATGNAGGGVTHNNMPPFLPVNFIIKT